MLLPEEAARANIYGFLARLLAAPPDEALLEAIAGADTVTAERGALVDPWLELAYAAASTDVDAVSEEYERAYCRTAASRRALERVVELCDSLRHLISQGELDLAAQCRFFHDQLIPAMERLRRLSAEAPGGRFYKHVGQFAAAFFRVEQTAFGDYS
jgi:TorA maturation chaperone TorD